MHQGTGHHKRQAKACLGGGGWVGVAGHIQGRLVGFDVHRGQIFGAHAHALLQGQGAIDGGKGVATAGMVFKSHVLDVEHPAQVAQHGWPVGAIAHSHAHAGLALQNIQGPGHTGAGGLRGQDTRFGGAASVQGLGHRVHAKGLL